jgi:hypothetical protein
MTTPSKPIFTVVSFLVIASVMFGLIYMLQPAQGLPAALSTEASGTSYPIQISLTATGYPPPPTPMNPIELATLAAHMTDEVLTIEDLTPLWFTPEPVIATPSLEGSIVYDPLNKFSLILPAGWYAYTPGTNATVGITTITNYNLSVIDSRPSHGVSLQISIGQLETEMSFEEWLEKRRSQEMSPEYGAAENQLTDPEPYQAGNYEGVTYSATSVLGDKGVVIYLLTNDRRLAGIGLGPIVSENAQARSTALTILSTLKIDPASAP